MSATTREMLSTTGCTHIQPYSGSSASKRNKSGISSTPFRSMEQIRDSLTLPIAWNCVMKGCASAISGIASTMRRKKPAA